MEYYVVYDKIKYYVPKIIFQIFFGQTCKH
jgi:hypothetical protein